MDLERLFHLNAALYVRAPRRRTLIGTLAPRRSRLASLLLRLDAEEVRRRRTDLFDEIAGAPLFPPAVAVSSRDLSRGYLVRGLFTSLVAFTSSRSSLACIFNPRRVIWRNR